MIRVLLALALVGASPASAQLLQEHPQPARWAAGVTLGAPMGLTLKRYIANGDALELELGFAYSPGVRFAASYLFNVARPAEFRRLTLREFIGVGPALGALSSPCELGGFGHGCSGDLYVAARVPLGVEAALHEAPLAFGFELAPGVGVVRGSVGFLLDAFATLRIFF